MLGVRIRVHAVGCPCITINLINYTKLFDTYLFIIQNSLTFSYLINIQITAKSNFQKSKPCSQCIYLR